MSKMGGPISYDDVPYPGIALSMTFPERLAVQARLFGLQTPPVPSCRVLELGCGTGMNSISMAYLLPGAEIVGIDQSGTQIAQGQQLIDQLGLKNIALRQGNILDLDESLGIFDYIVAYGVFSWVNSAVRERIVAICRQQLAPNGVALISYNTFPGWHMRGLAREMMLFHSRRFAASGEQAAQARALLSFRVDATDRMSRPGSELEVYHKVLLREQELLHDKPDYYLVHEHLEGENHPVYLYEFVDLVASYGLQYLADVRLSTMLPGTLPPDIGARLDAFAPNAVAVEQYMDFLLNRTFRQSLVCQGEVELDRTLRPERLFDLYVGSSVRPLFSEEGGPVRFTVPGTGTTLSVRHPISRAAMLHLIDQWPQMVHFEHLLAAARAGVDDEAYLQEEHNAEQEAYALAEMLLKCYTIDIIELQTCPPPLTLTLNERPRASALARSLAHDSGEVVNLRHEMVELDAPCTYLLRFLDGQHDRAALLALLQEQVVAGVLKLEEDDGSPADPSRYGEMLNSLLDTLLLKIARAGLVER